MTDERQDMLNHLQAAAKELIAAGRAALNVADEVLSDSIRLLGVFVAGRTASETEPPKGPRGPRGPKVERIQVEEDERKEP